MKATHALLDTPVTRRLGIEVPLICGAMYPCSNPELVAAVSEAGGIGVIQPLSMVYVHGHELAEGLKLIQGLTKKPVGMNVIVERSSKVYEERMMRFVDQAIEAGVRFFVTSLGNPRWGDEEAFVRALAMGYAGVQMGTRFIATTECTAHADYKRAIVQAEADDIVLTERITGVPVAVIRTPYIEKAGTKAGPIARWMLRGRKTKHWMRTIYALQSVWKL